ncbi:hypothetical protein ABFT80_08165 [Mesorhizobium sp. SB112]|uniref:hypothetical protein n=1 Tax=Mesorhizobium sp. SB112 TaxID=3151853 RepID=UPI003267F6AE
MGYAQEMADRMPPTMALPQEFHALFEWMEANNFLMPSNAYPGDRLGLLGPRDDLENERLTSILFRVATSEQAKEHGEAWFGETVPDIQNTLVPFARTGGDGSYAAFWLDDAGCQRIVHQGSEGLVCLLGETPLDFLRLLAIGYEEISGDGLYGPDAPPRKVGLNQSYRAWLTDQFDADIPKTASQVLGKIPDAMADTSDDAFWLWVRKYQNARDGESAT